ncbi:MAG: cysteine desulfurase, partial [Planctomycetales bacterium]|nr:cysteine desulfurase [Planctomycetales bacterium]
MIYFDNHSTTQLDPEVLAAMMPLLTWQFANPGSVTHVAGREVAERIEIALAQIANSIGGTVDELVITSGATESNNLALLGTCFHPRQKRRKVVSMTTEHRAVLDPLSRLARSGFEVVMLPVHTNEDTLAGMVDLQRLDDAVDEQTAIVSVMLANNEIGVIQPIAEIAKICHRSGALLHTDATQAVGRIVVDVDDLDVDLMSFSAHKFYGPKGVGGLFVRRRQRIVKLQSQIVGGGQQNNFRSGTLNSPGIVGMAAALQLCQKNNSLHPIAQLETNGFLHDPVACDGVEEWRRISRLTQRLYQRLSQELELVALNGP